MADGSAQHLPGRRERKPGTSRKLRPASGEEALQVCVHQFLRHALPDDVTYTAVDHAAKLTPRQAASRKTRGVKRGQADLRFVLPPHGRSAEIELKIKGGYQTPEQRAWESCVGRSGGLYAVCRSLDEVVRALTEWGVQLRARL